MRRDLQTPSGTVPGYVGSLHFMHPVTTAARDRGSARSARLTLLPDRLSIVPFGILRGTFRKRVIFNSQRIRVNPVMSAFASRQGILIGGHVGFDGATQEVYFFPRTGSVAEILEKMQELGYNVDLTRREPRIFG